MSKKDVKKEAKKVVELKKAIKTRKAKIAKHEGKLKKLKKKLKKAAFHRCSNQFNVIAN